MTGSSGLRREEWSHTQSVLTLSRLATSSAVSNGSSSMARTGGFLRCERTPSSGIWLGCEVDLECGLETLSSNDSSMNHLTTSVSFERDGCSGSSPIFPLYFAPVFIDASLMPWLLSSVRALQRTQNPNGTRARKRALLTLCIPSRTMEISAGFPQSRYQRARGIGGRQMELQRPCQIPLHFVFFAISLRLLRLSISHAPQGKSSLLNPL